MKKLTGVIETLVIISLICVNWDPKDIVGRKIYETK